MNRRSTPITARGALTAALALAVLWPLGSAALPRRKRGQSGWAAFFGSCRAANVVSRPVDTARQWLS
jgi:hypothetical protein